MGTDELKKMLAEATPGPWEKSHTTSQTHQVVGAAHVVRPKDPSIARIAHVSAWDADGPEIADESDANARLIAMAPDLAAEVLRLRDEVERLTEAMDAIAEWMDDPEAPGTKSVGGVKGAKKIARAALKTKGTE